MEITPNKTHESTDNTPTKAEAKDERTELKREENKRKRKVVVIVGATGSGKSDLGVKVAKEIGGEVVSVDSMQIYHGMDISSNKISENEMEGIPHHMLSFVDIADTTFDVRSFCSIASKKIEEIFERDKVPILVGGTHYFVYSLLWNTMVGTSGETQLTEISEVTSEKMDDAMANLNISGDISQQETEHIKAKIVAAVNNNDGETKTKSEYSPREIAAMFALLSQVDPPMAQKIHAKDVRKLEKSLKIFYSTGRRQSDIILQQKQNLIPMYDACILCLTVDKEVLDDRIDKRVDKMMERGLVKEVKEAWEQLMKAGVNMTDHTQGILQAIGLKEFAPLLEKLYSKDVEKQVQDEEKETDECVTQMKLRTRQYSRQQMKWIRKLVDGDGSNILLPITHLDATDLTKWKENVYETALAIVKSFLVAPPLDFSNTSNSNNNSENNKNNNDNLLTWKKYTCDTCGGKSLNGLNEWTQHCKSDAHRRKLKKLRKANAKC